VSARSDLMVHSFLELNGIEISNGARTIQYLRNGLGSDHWQIGEGCACHSLITDVCPSATTAEQCFVSPAADPAPWYDPDVPESGDFLGVLIKDVRPWFDGQAARNVTPRISGLGGASIGPQHPTPRTLQTPATLIAASCGGIEYGRRWLQYQLAGLCNPCQLGVARIRSFCADEELDDPTAGEWFVYEVGLIAGMTDTLEPDAYGQAAFEGGDDGCCDFVEGSLTLLAGNPNLYKRDVICQAATTLNPEGCSVECLDFCHWLQDAPPAVQCTIDPPRIGVLGAIITIDAGTGLSNLVLETLNDCDTGGLTGSLAIPYLPAGSTFVMDSALHTLTYTPDGGDPVDGTPYIELPFGMGIPWLEISSCDPSQCIQAQLQAICDSDCTATVQISTRLREG
jgi:hypothetical protein